MYNLPECIAFRNHLQNANAWIDTTKEVNFQNPVPADSFGECEAEYRTERYSDTLTAIL